MSLSDLSLPVHVVPRYDILVQVGQDASLAHQEFRLEEDACGAIHLNQMLNVVLLVQALLRNLHLLVAHHESLAPGGTATESLEATADRFEAGDERVGEVVCVEGLTLLNLLS